MRSKFEEEDIELIEELIRSIAETYGKGGRYA